MALDTLKCNHLMPLRFKGLTDSTTAIFHCKYPIWVHTFSYRFILYCSLFRPALHCILML